jgi:hypothetical protein
LCGDLKTVYLITVFRITRTREIKSRIAMAKAACKKNKQKKKKTFSQEVGFKFKEETSKVLYLEHSLILC